MSDLLPVQETRTDRGAVPLRLQRRDAPVVPASARHPSRRLRAVGGDVAGRPDVRSVRGLVVVPHSVIERAGGVVMTGSQVRNGRANTISERWVKSTPDEISHHSGDGHRYARWGQCVISYDEEREPIPAVYSNGWGGGEIQFGDERLTLDETEAFIQRLQNAVAYERAQGGESDG